MTKVPISQALVTLNIPLPRGGNMHYSGKIYSGKGTVQPVETFARMRFK